MLAGHIVAVTSVEHIIMLLCQTMPLFAKGDIHLGGFQLDLAAQRTVRIHLGRDVDVRNLDFDIAVAGGCLVGHGLTPRMRGVEEGARPSGPSARSAA
jgi:hypothetical protein